MTAVSNALEYAAIAFDRSGRRDVVGLTHDEDTINSQSRRCLLDHLAQRPGGYAAATSRRAHAVPDVTAVGIEDVAQRDPAEDVTVLDDPPGGSVLFGWTWRSGWVGQPQPIV